MPSHVLGDQGPPSILDSTSVPIPVTVTQFAPPKVTVTVQLDPAASTLSADPSFVSVDIDPSRATLVTDPNVNRSKSAILTSSVIAVIVVGVVAVITGEVYHYSLSGFELIEFLSNRICTLYISWLDLSTVWEASEKECASVYGRESGRSEGDV
jgi:hypothetical protein